MDVAARRRELRKRKILQNAEDRIKKLTGNLKFAVKDDERFSMQAGEANETSLTNDEHQSVQSRIKLNCETLAATDEIRDQNSLEYKEKNIKVQDNTDGPVVVKERVHESENKNFDEDRIDTEPQSEFPESETNNSDNKTSVVRSVVVMIFATLCFTKSLYLSEVEVFFWSMWFPEDVDQRNELRKSTESSFIKSFCLLETVLFFIPSIRKVMPGKQVNLWLLALKLSGVSPVVVDTFKKIVLEILEFLTDLAMFIFVLVILQNLKDLQV